MLENLLVQKRAAILEKWFHLILETYPANTSAFLKNEKDRFINPVGSTINQAIKTLYDELIHEMNVNKLSTALDAIIRIRSVQDFSPSQAIAFIFPLKRVIRQELESEVKDAEFHNELAPIESRIDQLTLIAFDIYMKCREEIFQIRVNEVKAGREMALKLLERTNRMVGRLKQEEDLNNNGI